MRRRSVSGPAPGLTAMGYGFPIRGLDSGSFRGETLGLTQTQAPYEAEEIYAREAGKSMLYAFNPVVLASNPSPLSLFQKWPNCRLPQLS